MSEKHTPGPWNIESCSYSSIWGDGHYIVETYGMNQEANARLIAAAPDLLFALKNLLAVKNGEGGTVFDSDEIARAAIAKATGEA